MRGAENGNENLVDDIILFANLAEMYSVPGGFRQWSTVAGGENTVDDGNGLPAADPYDSDSPAPPRRYGGNGMGIELCDNENPIFVSPTVARWRVYGSF